MICEKAIEYLDENSLDSDFCEDIFFSSWDYYDSDENEDEISNDK